LAVCSHCGNQRFGLKLAGCLACGRPGCERCLSSFGHVFVASNRYDARWICSWICYDRWAWSIVSQGHHLQSVGQGWALQGVTLGPDYAARTQRMIDTHERNLQLAHAKNLMDAERSEDAAGIYEGLRMWKEAGDARRTGRRAVTTQVQVNLNELIRQMRDGGLTTTYTCPACRSPILISGETASNLRTCSYCGSTIQTTDLVEFLRRAVG